MLFVLIDGVVLEVVDLMCGVKCLFVSVVVLLVVGKLFICFCRKLMV
jgi:hypothetical protein